MYCSPSIFQLSSSQMRGNRMETYPVPLSSPYSITASTTAFSGLYETKRYAVGVTDPVWVSPSEVSAAVRSCCLTSESATHRSEEHTSELQSRGQLVCRLLLEKKKRCMIQPRE